ncbi:MAG TPA: HAMP domain-containing sensor histidine kinase [Saprospiraceae bacterium]|nr:HAMP domain-containing sensor histidine kinase [Saprospiraceae bacterium]HMQ81908.1 HAMP domain-containing sensor histidine kinase [Saprospiraceae bacterium]
MNKKAIWAIIGLMSAAVFGAFWLQLDLIGTAVKVNEERFEKNIYTALNTVVQRVEAEENRTALNQYVNGYVTTYYESHPNNDANEIYFDFSVSRKQTSIIPQYSRKEILDKLMEEIENTCTCADCMAKKEDAYKALMVHFRQSNTGIPLEQRIKLKHIDDIIRKELTNRGIDTDYSYGIYNKETESFIIVDGHYVVEEQPTGELFNTRYKVELFPEEIPSPGLLMIHFPARTSFVWQSIWMNLAGAILFSALILFCFAYTISVIFQQKKLSEMKTDFINNMTHEFKTPIATISLAADSITNPIVSGNPDKVSRFANIIKQENKRMNSQVEKVLQMALLDKNDFSLKISEVNLHDIIHYAVENINLQLEQRGGQVSVQMNAESPFVEGDVTHISNIINNLLDNANKYSPETPDIAINTRNVSNGVEVTISDQGIGMSKEQLKHIFDKFYRVHTGNLHDVKGFGLGLSYVRAMMTAHKGQIDVKSELGKGSSFILFFPSKQ